MIDLEPMAGLGLRYPGKDGEFGRQDMGLVTSTNVFGVDYADPKATDDAQVLLWRVQDRFSHACPGRRRWRSRR